jgi:hypothetical protein
MLTSSTVLALALLGMPSSVEPAPLATQATNQIAQIIDTLIVEPSPSSDGPTDEVESVDIVESPTANYSDGQMSIDYPVNWQIAVSPDGNLQILDGTQGSADEVVTEVFVVDSPPGALINANIDSFIEEGAAVGPYGQVTIDEQRAFTILLADRPQTLSRAIATFIGYEDQTVFLFSSFTPENEAVEDRLLALHGSFQKLAAELESPETDSAESDATELDVAAPDSLELDDSL